MGAAQDYRRRDLRRNPRASDDGPGFRRGPEELPSRSGGAPAHVERSPTGRRSGWSRGPLRVTPHGRGPARTARLVTANQQPPHQTGTRGHDDDDQAGPSGPGRRAGHHGAGARRRGDAPAPVGRRHARAAHRRGCGGLQAHLPPSARHHDELTDAGGDPRRRRPRARPARPPGRLGPRAQPHRLAAAPRPGGRTHPRRPGRAGRPARRRDARLIDRS